ncbi:MAG: YiiD C-terminal domain-containing protein [Dyella sp.]
MTPAELTAQAQALTDSILADIPLNRAMQLRLHHYDGERLSFALPLAPNINDKGCAFGGALVSALTVAGWGLVVLALRQRGEHCEVFVGESTIRYRRPVWDDFRAEATLAEGADWARFFTDLDTCGKARIDVQCHVPGDDGEPLASLSARFVAKRHSQ